MDIFCISYATQPVKAGERPLKSESALGFFLRSHTLLAPDGSVGFLLSAMTLVMVLDVITHCTNAVDWLSWPSPYKSEQILGVLHISTADIQSGFNTIFPAQHRLDYSQNDKWENEQQNSMFVYKKNISMYSYIFLKKKQLAIW